MRLVKLKASEREGFAEEVNDVRHSASFWIQNAIFEREKSENERVD